MTQSRFEHPSTGMLAAFVEGKLSDTRIVEQHIDVCQECALTVIMARRIQLMASHGQIPPLTAEQRAEKYNYLKNKISSQVDETRKSSANESSCTQVDSFDLRECLSPSATTKGWIDDTHSNECKDTIENPAIPTESTEKILNRSGVVLPDTANTVVVEKTRQRLLNAITAASLLLAVGAGFQAWQSRAEIRLLTAERDQARKLRDSNNDGVGKQSLLLPTGDRQNRPVDWRQLLDAFYDKELSDDENLKELAKHSKDVEKAMIERRQNKPNVTAGEILAELFGTWGGPEEK